MPRPRQVSNEELLRVARACLIERGPTVSTSEIARQSGVSQAVLFQRFGTKDHLVRAALDSPDDPDWLELARRGPDARPPREQLLELAVAIHGYFDQMIPRWEALRGCGVQPEWDETEPAPLRFHRLLSGWFTRARSRRLLADHDARGAALGFLGALQVRPWFQHVARQAPGRGPRAYVESVVDLFWSGLAPGARGGRDRPARARPRKTAAKTTTRRQIG
jgi:AcrR family transcriptional regulator